MAISPFGATVPWILAALGYAAAAVVWLVAGAALPGGRWLAVHLLTLGVVTNLVLAFSQHFARTLTRSAREPVRWQPLGANTGVALVLIGRTTASVWAVALGAVVVTAAVFHSYLQLRQMRRRAVGARFGWIVRAYERAHGAFIHGALLGLLMAVGGLPGAWYASARVAHLHVNVLGWAGLTLLATLVFFGPTIVRTSIVQGADERAATALRRGATGLSLGVVLLFATGAQGTAGTVARLAAAAAIGVFAWAATVVCLPVAAAARSAASSTSRWPVLALSSWFPLAVWADVVVVATGSWRYLEAVGLAVLLGVLVQAMAATLTYVAPLLRRQSPAARVVLGARLRWGARVRSTVYNAGVVAVVVAAAWAGVNGAALARAGWALVTVALAWTLAAGARPLRAGQN